MSFVSDLWTCVLVLLSAKCTKHTQKLCEPPKLLKLETLLIMCLISEPWQEASTTLPTSFLKAMGGKKKEKKSNIWPFFCWASSDVTDWQCLTESLMSRFTYITAVLGQRHVQPCSSCCSSRAACTLTFDCKAHISLLHLLCWTCVCVCMLVLVLAGTFSVSGI